MIGQRMYSDYDIRPLLQSNFIQIKYCSCFTAIIVSGIHPSKMVSAPLMINLPIKSVCCGLFMTADCNQEQSNWLDMYSTNLVLPHPVGPFSNRGSLLYKQ